jgi:hypothetical protein
VHICVDTHIRDIFSGAPLTAVAGKLWRNLMATMTTAPTLDIDVEADMLSRMLSSIAMHSDLKDALMDFHHDLPLEEASERSLLVLRLMDDILPSNVAARLQKTRSHATQSPSSPLRNTRHPFFDRLLVPLTVVAGTVVISLCVAGAVSTYHLLISFCHTLRMA